MIYSSMIDNQKKEKKNWDSMIEDVNDSGQMEPTTGGNKEFACGVAQ